MSAGWFDISITKVSKTLQTSTVLTILKLVSYFAHLQVLPEHFVEDALESDWVSPVKPVHYLE
jgi:hypothetical protein